MAAVAQGDRAAFGRLVKRHAGRLMRLAARVTGERAAAEDVVQEGVREIRTGGAVPLVQFDAQR